MEPYYDHEGITLWCADARTRLPFVAQGCESVITDPVWPNAVESLAGADDPGGLLAETLDLLPESVRRVVIHLGCGSDPRFLLSVPSRFPFLRQCNLEYVRPHYKGRMLYTHDVAYAFGEWPDARPGATVVPGRVIQNDSAKRTKGHPCPRQLQHVAWLVKFFAGKGPVCDPFCGTGTTLLACKNAGIRAVGIEVSEEFCAIAVKNLAQGVLWGAAGVA